jgi:REP-associated tyrosine transposase
MPRPPRLTQDGLVYHIVNRANRRARIFRKPADYKAFLVVVTQALGRFPIRLLAFCVMPNHWHLVIWPEAGTAIPAFMHWITSTHVRRYQKHYDLTGSGHLYQARYRSSAVAGDTQLLNVLCYVEANPLTAGLCDRAEAWRWSSASTGGRDGAPPLAEWPIGRPPNWLQIVNEYGRTRVEPATGGSP